MVFASGTVSLAALHGGDDIRDGYGRTFEAEVAGKSIEPEMTLIHNAKEPLEEKGLSDINFAPIQVDAGVPS